MTNTNDKRSASQRIEDLERAVMAIYQTVNNMARENSLIKNALKLMDNKIGSLMKASVAGEALTEDNIAKHMRQAELAELKEKVTNLVTQGFLVPTDVIGDGDFIVGSEDEPDAADGTTGKIVHERLQFTLASLDKEIQEKLKGAKVGETVRFKEDALVFKVREIYKIVNPTPEPAPDAVAPPPAEVSPATPSAPAEQSSSNAEVSQPAPEAAQSSQNTGN